ncbi:sulfotransferase [Sphingomonas sp. IW22]|uniref:tetratricopeptide repeat-containing sulfotransferase family protein n=1 Tax=Sphingomonas sp. IW22 TaxID=3242489 RepID=UPI0035220C4F
MTLAARARAALARGDLPGAADAALALTREQPSHSDGWFLLALTAAEQGQVQRALTLIEAALEWGSDAEHLAQYARLLILARRDGEAGDAARRALTAGPVDARTFDTVGCVLARLGDHEGSVAPFERAVTMAGDNPSYRYNLAAACGFTGRVAAARDHYEAILADNPGDARVHYALSILSRQTPDDAPVARLKAALAAASVPADRLRLSYALAKTHEDLGDAAAAFAYLSAANAEHRRAIGYDFAQDAAIFDAVEAAFARLLPPSPGDPDPAPIFVVGMPRTGTTLVDRILSSHRDVGSAGELQAMPLAVKQMAATRSRMVIDAQTVAAGATADPSAIAAAYLARAQHHRPAGKARFVDKLPANFLYVGHIARAFPNARIVCLRRHPMDTVWSNYKNLFASQSAYYAYSYDLIDTARYYQRFDRLMALWEQLFPGRVLQLSYEALVADQVEQTRRLLDHAGLAWDDACLSFHENRAAVATPSAAQVRRPLNADAVARWRRHEAALAPVADWFVANGIPID